MSERLGGGYKIVHVFVQWSCCLLVGLVVFIAMVFSVMAWVVRPQTH